ncbi:MAG: NAD(P)/FAD-dependent oxidoreductase [Pyrobaculum sp.]
MKIAVVGAGPAGLSFAAVYKDVEVFEEHIQLGLPRHCTSLVSARSAEELGVSKRLILNKFYNLVLTNLEGANIYFRIRDGVYLLDRPGLENWLAERVSKIYIGERVVDIRGGYVYTSKGEKRGPYKYVVVSEGAVRRFSSRFGHVVRLPGLQIDVKSAVGLSDITVVYNQKISKSYFSWIVEIDRGLYRVGLADSCCVVEKLNKLIKLIRGEPVGKPFGGGVLAGPPLRRVVDRGLIFIGDAGGFVKPLSGGGIILALKTGRLAAEAVSIDKPEAYQYATAPLRLKLRTAFHAFRILYGGRLVDRLLEILKGGSYVAVDYDDHLRTLFTAALTDIRSLYAVKEFLRYLTSYRYVSHLF